MPIYRAEQSRFSFAAESAGGGYFDIITAVTDAAAWTASINVAAGVPAGSRSLVFDGGLIGTLSVGDYIQIGTGAVAEIRRISSLGSYNGTGDAGTVFIDYPTAFFHDNNEVLDEKTVADITLNGRSYITFLPGVYETVAVSDMETEITPHYFLSTSAVRNPTRFYRGKQGFAGSLSDFILLNGFPIRFPIGRITTVGTDAAGGGGSTSSAATRVGDISLPVTDRLNYAVADLIQIDTGASAEVRQIITGIGAGAGTFTLNYPLMIAHSSGAALNEVISPFTHTARERNDIDYMTWNLQLRDSAEAVPLSPGATNPETSFDFMRRYVGGKVNRATLKAEEGEMLRMSWDDVTFLDMVHNQVTSSVLTITPKSSSALLPPAGIGGAWSSSGVDGVYTNPAFPTTEPYYFSQGSLTFFGVVLARIRRFEISIENNIDPRYYIRSLGSERIPFELQEQRRAYRMTATIATEDSLVANSTVRTLFKELMSEGNYTAGFTGLAISMVFRRGTNDIIVITIPPGTAGTIPASETAGVPGTGIDAQSAFILRAPTPIGTDSPVQVEVDIVFRSMQIEITDSIGTYP